MISPTHLKEMRLRQKTNLAEILEYRLKIAFMTGQSSLNYNEKLEYVPLIEQIAIENGYAIETRKTYSEECRDDVHISIFWETGK